MTPKIHFCPKSMWTSFVCLFGFNVAFKFFSHTVSGCDRKLSAHFYSAASLKYIMAQTFDMIPHPVTLSWDWVNQRMTHALPSLVFGVISVVELSYCPLDRSYWSGDAENDLVKVHSEVNWATAQQNQQNAMFAQRRLGSAWAFTVCSISSYGHNVSSCRQRRLIRLGGCPGWSES